MQSHVHEPMCCGVHVSVCVCLRVCVCACVCVCVCAVSVWEREEWVCVEYQLHKWATTGADLFLSLPRTLSHTLFLSLSVAYTLSLTLSLTHTLILHSKGRNWVWVLDVVAYRDSFEKNLISFQLHSFFRGPSLRQFSPSFQLKEQHLFSFSLLRKLRFVLKKSNLVTILFYSVVLCNKNNTF